MVPAAGRLDRRPARLGDVDERQAVAVRVRIPPLVVVTIVIIEEAEATSKCADVRLGCRHRRRRRKGVLDAAVLNGTVKGIMALLALLLRMVNLSALLLLAVTAAGNLC